MSKHCCKRGEPLAFLRSLAGHTGQQCVRWPYSLNSSGYGYTYVESRWIGAPRLICIFTHGEPVGYREAAHECGNRWCVNPSHLTWKTKSENGMDRRRHGTSSLGSNGYRATLTEAQALEVLNSALRTSEIASKYSISARTVRRIKTGARWPHLRWSDNQEQAA